jgi:hypothetical protein
MRPHSHCSDKRSRCSGPEGEAKISAEKGKIERRRRKEKKKEKRKTQASTSTGSA